MEAENRLTPLVAVALAKLKPGALRRLLLKAGDSDSDWLVRLALVLSQEPLLPVQVRLPMHWQALLRHGRVSAQEATSLLDCIVRKGEELTAQANYADAWLLLHTPWLEPLPFSLRQPLQALLLRSLACTSQLAPQASTELQQQIYEFFSNLLHVRYDLTADVLQAVLNLLLDLSVPLGFADRLLGLLRMLRGRNRTPTGQPLDHSEEQRLVLAEYRLLKAVGQTEPADRLMKENLWIPAFGQDLVRQHLAAGNTDEAAAVLQQAMAGNNSEEWEPLMLELALHRGDKQTIRRLALKLFLHTHDFRYYRQLRQTYAASHWPQQVKRIVGQLRQQKDFFSRGIDVTVRIWMMEEHCPDKLVELLRKNCSLPLLNRYEPWLRTLRPEALLELYAKALRRYAENHSGKEAYEEIINTLRTMLRLPNSTEAVRSLIIELKVLYRQRRALVRLLNEVVV
ncbi:MAG: hypothetical protein NZL95_06240 [Chitinophagales bacterium]|nr:hypothetical protein [Chitinophagales bacterium]MDW8428136.1 hypothetical protein [Chitinophagales bacterium]